MVFDVYFYIFGTSLIEIVINSGLNALGQSAK